MNTPPTEAIPGEPGQKLKRLNRACFLLFLLVVGTAWALMCRDKYIYLHAEYGRWVDERYCGRVFLYSMYYFLGIAGMFYMIDCNREARRLRSFVWGWLQLGGSYVLAFPTVYLCLPFLSDGGGMAAFILAPVLTLPSYLSAWGMAFIVGNVSEGSARFARWLCIIILLGIVTLSTALYVRAEIEGRQKHEAYRAAHPEWH